MMWERGSLAMTRAEPSFRCPARMVAKGEPPH